MNILQIALLGNGIFSLTTGLFLLIFKNRVARWFGQEKSLAFLIIGLGLLYFSYSIFEQLKNPELGAVFYIIVQDLIWVLASIVILLIKPFNITVLGNQIITGVAFVVLFFGVGQSVGLAQTDSIKEKGIKRLSFERVINASKENTWKTISDVANYHQVAPNIDSVEIISGEGEGMVRSCTHKKDKWTEIATLWDEGEQYSFKVNTDAEDYPYPLKYLQGTWKVEKISGYQTKITMVFEFTYKRRIYNLLIHPFMKKQFDKICRELLDNWQNELEAK
ncbi:type II toxin-antitoxin system RatA family toxin [Flavivirga eckloniae]|uniref:Coenzyme Q-binding protein COQ10 START domain-containing protein n=1 Tax=Flavivirga eckloniae TaxID=1803846 RepID=A0A2K9PMN0_9FLAO|nr:SRPBCC family protein [Flavivirga eckloniae]AUP78321.1 hypothetical protein C1H87_06175 [Flavivirga eckloniae]